MSQHRAGTVITTACNCTAARLTSPASSGVNSVCSISAYKPILTSRRMRRESFCAFMSSENKNASGLESMGWMMDGEECANVIPLNQPLIFLTDRFCLIFFHFRVMHSPFFCGFSFINNGLRRTRDAVILYFFLLLFLLINLFLVAGKSNVSKHDDSVISRMGRNTFCLLEWNTRKWGFLDFPVTINSKLLPWHFNATRFYET